MTAQEQLTHLLWNLARAYIYGYPHGTVGGNKVLRRQRLPQVGDFVVILGTLRKDPDGLFGTLEAIDPPMANPEDEHQYTRAFTIKRLDGSLITWRNVRCLALPVGDVFADDVDEKFKPEGI